jgi:putative nucleotidyltransferase with HDIG domain
MNNPGTITKDELDRYLDTVEHLPPTPALMIRLIELFRQPDRDVDEIVEVMRQDPSLTAEVLRRCNSSFYGNETPVTDINDAIFQVGFHDVYCMTVALFGQQSLSSNQAVGKTMDVEVLWRHSALTAIASGTLARELGDSEGIAFTAGLLHDVGKIVLASAEGPVYAQLLKEYAHSGAPLNHAEKNEFGFSHDEIGARLLKRWGVPEQISEPVLHHHDTGWPESSGHLAAIICLADLMTHSLDGTSQEMPDELPEAAPAMTFLGLKPESMPALVQAARSDMKRLSSLLSTS